LTDIGFYWCFMDCDPDHYREVFFNGFGLFSINVCWTSINFWIQRYSWYQCLTRAVLPFYSRMVITVLIVYQRGQNVLLPPFAKGISARFVSFFYCFNLSIARS